jgi:hypothetical protein
MANMRVLISVLVASALLVGSAFAAEDKKPQFKPPPGYKVKINGWDIVYCRKEAVLGSRFKKEICMTEAELKAYLASQDEIRRNKDQTSRVCAGTGCN